MMPIRIRDISLLVSCTFATAFGRCGSGQGVVVRCTRLRSAYITKMHYARFMAYLGTSIRLWFQKQVYIRRIAAYPGTSLRSWFKKKRLLPIGISIFFLKIPPILKLEVGFFSGTKKFFADFPKYGKFFLSKLHFCKFS